MSDILEEILVDQSEEKRIYFVRKLLSSAFILTLVIIAAMIFYNIREQKNIKYNQEISDTLLEIMDNSNLDHDSKIKSLEVIAQVTQSKVRELSSIKKAQVLIEHGDLVNAKIILEQMVKDVDYNSLSRAYARLIWLGLLIDNTNPTEEEARTGSEYFNYFSDESAPFYGTASIIKSMWQVKTNQLELARQTLAKTIDSINIPRATKEQAKALLSNIENNKGL